MGGEQATVEVRAESPYRTEAIALFEELWRELGTMYGDVGPCRFTPEQVDHAGGAFVIAWLDGVPAGCGAIRRLEPGIAEVKRMYVRPEARRRGIARAILADLENRARAMGYRSARLETGDVQPEAVALYEREGYARIPCYGQHAEDLRSICFEKQIA